MPKVNPKPQYQLSQGKERPYFRAIDVRRDDDIKTLHIEFKDIDSAILKYMNDTIKPSITVNNTKVDVPIIYGSAEKWKMVQKDGWYRDPKNNAISAPLIMIKQTNVEKQREITRNVNPNHPNIFIQQKVGYSAKNRYDRFSALTNAKPVEEYYNIIVPDYYTITYSGYIWTNFIEHMNILIENLSYHESSYWGQENYYKFFTTIKSFEKTTEISDSKDRVVRSPFTMTVLAYIVSDNIHKSITQQSEKSFSKPRIITTEKNDDIKILSMIDNNTYTPIVDPLQILEVSNDETEAGYTIPGYVMSGYFDETNREATFYNTSITVSDPPYTLYDFKFFYDDVFIQYDFIDSFVQQGNDMLLTLLPGAIIDMNSNTVIKAVGPFTNL